MNHQVSEAMESIHAKQVEAATLRKSLDRSLTLKSLFPDCFDGPNPVTTRGLGKLAHSLRTGSVQLPYRFWLRKASGVEVPMTFDQFKALKGLEYTEHELVLIEKHWVCEGAL